MFTSLDVLTHISFPVTVIWLTNKQINNSRAQQAEGYNEFQENPINRWHLETPRFTIHHILYVATQLISDPVSW